MRRTGILLPISSLPSPYGIGCFSREAYDFVDFLHKAGVHCWQILPLGPTGYGDSPYQSFSTFAGNPYFIDLGEFIKRGWLTEEECQAYDYGNASYVEYETIYKTRKILLKKAFMRSNIAEDLDYEEFVRTNYHWLDDYALYMAIKDDNKSISWLKWDKDLKSRDSAAISDARSKLKEEYNFYCFQQYFFDNQWKDLKAYANSKGIRIIGDIPIYVAEDSADTWSEPWQYQLDEDCNPVAVAGCPPDYFSPLGQLWGNPLYDWKYHKKAGFDWWIRRMERCYQLYDEVKIDHFRGFDEYYSIPAGREDAVIGEWREGPGYDLFKALEDKLGKRALIIEDLGFMTKSVRRLVKKVGSPNMKVICFGFDGTGMSEHLPHNYNCNCVAYTGTHDNDTVAGWYDSLKRREKKYVRDYLGAEGKRNICDRLIRALMGSPANTVILPVQDLLVLGTEARMNTPSTLGDNWKWRLTEEDMCLLDGEIAERLLSYGRIYGRYEPLTRKTKL